MEEFDSVLTNNNITKALRKKYEERQEAANNQTWLVNIHVWLC